MRGVRQEVVLVVALTSATANAQLLVPPLITDGGRQNDPLVHAGYLDATLYGANPDGGTDSTAAIQAAMNDANNYAMVTYLPPGTYLVSRTLLGESMNYYVGAASGPGAAPCSGSSPGPGWATRGSAGCSWRAPPPR